MNEPLVLCRRSRHGQMTAHRSGCGMLVRAIEVHEWPEAQGQTPASLFGDGRYVPCGICMWDMAMWMDASCPKRPSFRVSVPSTPEARSADR